MNGWLFDLGNTRLKCARLDDAGDAAGTVLALPHEAEALALPDDVQGEVALVSSVAPEAARVALLQCLSQRFRRIHLARTLPHCGALTIAYPLPERLGVDRFLSLLAIADDRRDTLLVGVGTALTIDLLRADGQHLGGRIAPSPTLMREMLAERSAALPAAGGRYVEFADDTSDALASGCDGAALALIERSMGEAATQLGHAPRLLVHGGGVAALLPMLNTSEPANTEPRTDLVLRGLAHWARWAGVA
ncbi:type III pantothenate kinase [Solilutibacter silvestris]|uniref:Type III pantothenate kinase n=1 Tax=Solilutibacter silvestris TaxID=1645665 RepID=A0A2K1Q2A3_9GAMM|nr:type III pantothenate kinase [Lysobacter silvestris]PNS09163.1 baf: pantothenate kinase, type III [Lysobacter silvestris]